MLISRKVCQKNEIYEVFIRTYKKQNTVDNLGLNVKRMLITIPEMFA